MQEFGNTDKCGKSAPARRLYISLDSRSLTRSDRVEHRRQVTILARLLRLRLEALIPQIYGDLATLVHEYRESVKQAISLPKMRRRFWEQVLQGPIAEMVFAGDVVMVAIDNDYIG